MPTYFIEGGGNVHFEEANPDGHPVAVLLHGLGSAGEDWQLQFPALTGLGMRVVAPDVPGFGWSPWPGGKVSIPRFAEMIARFMQGVGAVPAHLMGISMGGTIALQLALDHPQWTTSLVLVNTFPRLRPRKPADWLYFLMRAIVVRLISPGRQADMVKARIFPRPDQEELRRVLKQHILQADPKVYRGAMGALFRFDVYERLGELQMPTLVVTGAEDTTVDPAIQEEMARRIPRARQVIIPGAGHAVTADSAEAFNRTVVEFYRQVLAG